MIPTFTLAISISMIYVATVAVLSSIRVGSSHVAIMPKPGRIRET